MSTITTVINLNHPPRRRPLCQPHVPIYQIKHNEKEQQQKRIYSMILFSFKSKLYQHSVTKFTHPPFDDIEYIYLYILLERKSRIRQNKNVFFF